MRPKTYNFKEKNNDENIKAKGTRKCNIIGKLKFADWKDFLEAN